MPPNVGSVRSILLVVVGLADLVVGDDETVGRAVDAVDAAVDGELPPVGERDA